MERGTILFHKSFDFANGDVGEKLLIVLNSNPDPARESYLICRVTSQEKNKPKSFGCHEELSLFFLPAGHDFFHKDTWIQLHEIFAFDANELLQDHFEGELEIRGELEQLTMKQLLNCIKKVMDISQEHKKLILGK